MQTNLILVALITAILYVRYAPAVDAPPKETAPTNPIKLEIEIGGLTNDDGKVTVLLQSVITRNTVTHTLLIRCKSDDAPARLEVPMDDVPALIDALAATLARPDKKFKQNIRGFAIENYGQEKRTITVRVRIDEHIGSFMNRSIDFNVDGATSLVSILKDGVSQKAWLDARISAIQPANK